MSLTEEIKQRVDLFDVVSESVQLQKSGRNWKANCPFHQEKTPSFYVFPDRQYWQCFGACAEGGDVFSFVQKREGLDFREALRQLAARAGVEMRSQSGRPAGEDDRFDRLRAANEAAAAFYHSLLLQSAQGADALQYAEGRGLDGATIRAFQLGFAPGRGAMLSHLSERGFSSSELVEAGVCIEGERGLFDRFHDRLIFPIRDERGRVVGMGGRTMVDDPAKYLNTPQTPIFDKSGLLYALDKARDAIREKDQVVIVEGYMDVIAAHQFEHRNVIASMGTALTEKQVHLLKRFTRHLVLALDADAAGTEATLRGIEVAAGEAEREATPVVTARGFVRLQEQSATEIKILSIPEGKDPDELIRRDPARWEELIAGARPVVDHLLEQLPARFDVNDPREAAKAVDLVVPALAAIVDPITRDLYVQRLARLVHVDENVVRARLTAPAPPRRRPANAGGPPATSAPPARARTAGEPVEEYLLALLFSFPALREIPIAEPRSLFTISAYNALYDVWLQSDGSEELWELVPEELEEDYTRITQRVLPPLDDESALAALEETVWRLEQRNRKRAKHISADAIAEMEAQAREQGAQISQLLAAGEESESQLSADEVRSLAEVYLEDYHKGLELYERLAAREPAQEPLTDQRKEGIRATMVNRAAEGEAEDAAWWTQ
ncbi:MAG: DNA primase [Dehalococcoidia bacterium]